MMTTPQYSGDPNLLPIDGLIPIRTVSSLTGVNPVTLRAWERRYGLIKPVRTPKGHRLYTMADVDLINQAVALLEGGMSISQVGRVLSADKVKVNDNQEDNFDPWAAYQGRLMQAIVRFDDLTLNDIYNEALSLYPIDIVTSKLIVPFLRELGWRWESAQGSIAEEHFFSVFLRNKLGARFHHRSRHLGGTKLVVACLPEEQHEVGILLFALAAADRDYRLVLLGANTPLAELPTVVERADCKAIILSGSAETPALVVRKQLPQLLQQVGVPVFIGGRVAVRYAKELAATSVICLSDDYSLALRKMDAVLSCYDQRPKEALQP
jgi:DNA-binding transcriptional MerR regulator